MLSTIDLGLAIARLAWGYFGLVFVHLLVYILVYMYRCDTYIQVNGRSIPWALTTSGGELYLIIHRC